MWLKIEGASAFHPKVLAAGNEAWGAFVRMTAWSCENLLEGHISDAVAKTITSSKVIKKLIEVGLLHSDDSNYRAHDYRDYNPSAAKQIEIQEARKAAGRVGGQRSGASRSQAKEKATGEAKTKQMLQQNSEQKRTPYSVPVFIDLSIDRQDSDPSASTRHGAFCRLSSVDMPAARGEGEGAGVGFVEATLADHPGWRESLEVEVGRQPRTNPDGFRATVLREWIARGGPTRNGVRTDTSEAAKAAVPASHYDSVEWEREPIRRHLRDIPRGKFELLEARARGELARRGRNSPLVESVAQFMAKAHLYDVVSAERAAEAARGEQAAAGVELGSDPVADAPSGDASEVPEAPSEGGECADAADVARIVTESLGALPEPVDAMPPGCPTDEKVRRDLTARMTRPVTPKTVPKIVLGSFASPGGITP